MRTAVCFSCLFVGLAAMPVVGSAQSHVIDARVSVGSVSVRDDLLVPLAFTGLDVGLGARWSFAEGDHRVHAEISAGTGLLFNRFGHEALQLSHGLAAGWAVVVDAHEARTLAVGGVVRWHDELSYLASWDDAHGYWLSTLLLATEVRDVRPLSSGVFLESRAEVALFGVASRPPARRMNKQDDLTLVAYHLDRLGDETEVVWIATLQSIRLESMVRFRDAGDAEGARFGVGAYVTFARAADPEPYTLLLVGITGAWGGRL